MTRRFSNHTYHSPDGLRLYAKRYPGIEGRTPLLCMHGLTRNADDFDALLTELPDWPAISVDQRGRARSDYNSDSSLYRPDIYCADMFALLADLNLSQVIAVGTSMGGLMAMMMAQEKPDVFKGIILNDIGPEVAPAGLARLRSYVGQAMSFANWEAATAAVQAQGPDIFPDFTKADWEAFARCVCEETDTGQIVFRYDPAISKGVSENDPSAVPPDLWPLYTSSKATPTLIIRAETSDILSAETAEQMIVGREKSSLATIPNRGHAPTLTEPAALKAIKRFLESLS